MTAPASSSPAGTDNGELRQALEGWRTAWSKREVDAYLAFYAPGFVPPTGGGRDAWTEKRKAVLGGTADISVEISDLTVTLPDATHAVTVFKQTYRSPNYRDVVIKTLQWAREGDRWLIMRESSAIPVPARP
jgi:adhesin transport system outer membrane protein